MKYLPVQPAMLVAVALLAQPNLAASALNAPPALKLVDAQSVNEYGTSAMIAADADGNGRPEVVMSSALDLWRRLIYQPETGDYVFDLVVPMAFPEHEGRPAMVARLEQGGADKVISRGNVTTIHDLKTGVLERISSIAHGLPELVAVADLTGDGANEFIFGSGTGLFIYDNTLSRQLAAPSLPGPASRVLVGNFDGEAGMEVLLRSGEIFKFSGLELEYHNSVELDLDGEPRDLMAADVNCDGRDDIVAFYFRSTAVIDALSGELKWHLPYQSKERWIAGHAVADLTGNGCMDVIVAENSHPDDLGFIVGQHGDTGQDLVRVPNLAGTIPEVVAGGDFDGDGRFEIMAYASRPFAFPDRLYLYDVASGALKWQSLQEAAPGRALALGDVNGDGQQELVFLPGGLYGDEGIRLYARDPLTFAPLWAETAGLPASTTTVQTMSVAVGDVEDNGRPDIVVGTSNNGMSHVWILDGTTREAIRGIPIAVASTVSSILIEDIDGDGTPEIIVGTQPLTTAGVTGIYVIQPGSWSVTQIYNSVGFGDVYALQWADIDGDGAGELVFVEDRFVTSYSLLVRLQPDTAQATVLLPDQAFGMLLLDVTGSGAAEIVIGRRDGFIDVLDGAGASVHASGSVVSSTRVCTTAVYALARNELPGAGETEAYFACHDRIGAIDLASGEFRILTGVVGNRVGIGNSLIVAGTSASEPRITTTTFIGWIHLAPAEGIPPSLVPPQVKAWLSTHWKKSVVRNYDLLAYNGTPVDVEVLEPPLHGELVPYPTTGPAFQYSPKPFRGRDHFVVRAVAGDQVSVPVTIFIDVYNAAPTTWSSSYDYTVEAGSQLLLGPSVNDADGDPLLYVVADAPTKGVIETTRLGEPLSMTYTPAPGAAGQDTFTFRAFDQVDYSAPATVTITIVQPAPPPTTPPPPASPPSNPGDGGGGSLGWPELLSLLLAGLAAGLPGGRRRWLEVPSLGSERSGGSHPEPNTF